MHWKLTDDFGNFDYETGLNILAGMQSRRGTFVELKTSLYSGPAPKLRLILVTTSEALSSSLSSQRGRRAETGLQPVRLSWNCIK
jgi:hypothetical protein